MAKTKTNKISSKVENSAASAVENKGDSKLQNGLGDAIGFMGGGAGFPFNQGSPYTEQLSNVNTIFKNLRWYLVSNFRQVLSEAYVELGLVQTIVDVPVDDAIRGGVEISSKELDEDEIKQLQSKMDRENDLGIAAQAAKWNRLFGGAGIMIITDQDPETELDLSAIEKDSPLMFRAVDMWELFWNLQDTDGYDAELQEAEYEFYDYYSKRVHVSRVMKLIGLASPSFIRPRLRGWGFSVVEKLVRSLNQYLKATDLSFEVLDEFKLDVYKIKNLVNTVMSERGQQAIQKRIQMANFQKNYQNALVMDSEDDYDHKNLSFAGIAEAMAGIRMQIASDMRMPLTKLFGISAAGFNSGEDDIEVYNAMVESEVRTKIKYDILRMIEIRCQQMFGFIPSDLSIGFKPLRVMTSEQEENVKTAKFNRLLAARQAGEVTAFEFREALNKENLLGITLDNAGDDLNPDDPDIAAQVAGAPEQDINQDPGQDREPTEKTISGDEQKDEKSAKAVPKVAEKAAKAPSVKNTSMKERLANLAYRRSDLKKNSAQYERAAFETDGGVKQYAEGRELFFESPTNEGLYLQACELSQEAYGKRVWQFIVWWYLKQGGSFNEAY